MKKIIFLFVFTVFCKFLLAQKVRDSILVARDTIHVYGKVVDKLGHAVSGALVLSETLDENYNYVRTKTDEFGNFALAGVNPNDVLRVRREGIATETRIKGTRKILITLLPLDEKRLNSDRDVFSINAKRISERDKYKYKATDSTIYLGFHPFGHHNPATYPGGMQKFYDFIKNNLVYPKRAIESNVEGLVAVAFTIDRFGIYKDFVVIRDIGYGCAEELLKVIKKSKKWYPAMNGLFVDERIILEIPFKLID